MIKSLRAGAEPAGDEDAATATLPPQSQDGPSDERDPRAGTVAGPRPDACRPVGPAAAPAQRVRGSDPAAVRLVRAGRPGAHPDRRRGGRDPLDGPPGRRLLRRSRRLVAPALPPA